LGENSLGSVRGRSDGVMMAKDLFLRSILHRALPLAVLAVAIPLRTSAQTSAAWTTGCAGVSSSKVENVTWTPTACQEFNSTTVGPPDTAPWTVWSFDTGNNGFGNSELETYCGPPNYPGNPAGCPTTFDPGSANSYLDGKGHLVIQISDVGGTWYSARMKTQGTQAFQYGRIEASAELPDLSTSGLWPAFWWLGTNISSVGWPACGESDIMEAWADTTACGPPAGNTVNHSTIHYEAGSGPSSNFGRYTFPSGEQMNTAFYAYGVIWSANMLQYYVNPPTTTATSTIQPFFVVTASDLHSGASWPYNASSTTTGPAFLLLNVAVGGACGGTLPAPPGPYQMLVDYVRDYGASAITAPSLGNPPSITLAAGATTGNTSTFTPALTSGTGYVYFACDTSAPKATCSIKTSDPLDQYVVNSDAGESVTVSVTTTSNAASFPAFSERYGTRPMVLLLTVGIALLLLRAARRREQCRNWRATAAVAGFAAVTLLAALMMSCGGPTGGSNGSGGGNNGTPPGTYTVTVYAFTESNTSNGANANADAKTSIALTVQ
jgi:beta-glucanase (GH16 family)